MWPISKPKKAQTVKIEETFSFSRQPNLTVVCDILSHRDLIKCLGLPRGRKRFQPPLRRRRRNRPRFQRRTRDWCQISSSLPFLPFLPLRFMSLKNWRSYKSLRCRTPSLGAWKRMGKGELRNLALLIVTFCVSHSVRGHPFMTNATFFHIFWPLPHSLHFHATFLTSLPYFACFSSIVLPSPLPVQTSQMDAP